MGKILVPALIGVTGLAITGTASANEVEVIKSPITYIEDKTLTAGERKVEKKGQDGKLEFKTNQAGEPTVKKTSPTETRIKIGTKEKVERVVDKHQITYQLDETKNVGDNIEVKGEDGIKKETTTYKVVETIDPKLLLPESEDDKRLVRANEEVKYDRENDKLIYTGKYYFNEKLKEAESVNLSTLKTREQHIKAIEKLSYKWRLDLIVSGNLLALFPETGDAKSTEDIKRFHNSNYVSDKHIDIIKADYQLAKELIDNTIKKYGPLSTEEEGFYSEKDNVNNLLASLEYLIKLYESGESKLGAEPKININYSNNITPEFKVLFEKEVNKLPAEIKRMLPTITFEDIWSGGLASPSSNRIQIDDDIKVSSWSSLQTVVNTKIDTLLHELGHVVDFKGGNYSEKIDEDNDGKLDYNVYAFSHSPEWLNLWKKYFQNNEKVGGYFSYHSATIGNTANIEAFAESFGQYIRKRVYGIEYDRHYVFDNVKNKKNPFGYYSVAKGKSVYVSEENRSVSYEEAYDIFSKVEPYFERLYNQLFGQPRVAKVVEDRVTTERIKARKDGKVIYGAKPKIENVVVSFTTKTIEDSNLAVGERKLIQRGKNGQKQIITRYRLKNNITGGLETSVTESIISSAQDEIYAVGTKIQTGWVKENKSWYYKDNKGKNVKNQWQGEYYLKSDGKMAENEWIYDNNYKAYYYLDKDGVYQKNKWQGDYYLKSDGKRAVSEWIYDSYYQGYYYLQENGIYAKNKWQGDYYLKSDGKMATKEWIYDNNQKAYYYIEDNGVYARNRWQGSYYLKSDGKMAANEWIYDNAYKAYYYLDKDGVYQKNKWQDEYYLKSDGKRALEEWIYDNSTNSYYYIELTGLKARNRWQGDYYLKSDGKMAKNEWTPDGYYVDQNGRWDTSKGKK